MMDSCPHFSASVYCLGYPKMLRMRQNRGPSSQIYLLMDEQPCWEAKPGEDSLKG